MAGATAAVAAPSSPFLLPLPVPGNPHVRASSLTSSFPSRTRRTNHLRQKILKTLENKPYPDPSQPEFPLKTHTISIEETLHRQPAESDQLSTSVHTGFVDSILGTFSTRSFAKMGMYLIGAFIFQTICAVLIFRSNDLFCEDDNLDSDNLSQKKSKSKSSLLLSENQIQIRSSIDSKDDGIGVVGESEMDNKIMEIQEMARRARLQEQLEGNRKGFVEEEEEDDDDDVDDDSIEITVKKKEINNRLSKLTKSFEGDYQKPGPKIARKEGDVGKNVGNDSLMFKKKYKYKNPLIDSWDKPKGFNSTKDVHVDNVSIVNGITVDGGTLQTDKKDDVISGPEVSVSKDENKAQKPTATKTKSTAGTSMEPKFDKQTSRAEKSGKSSNLETKKPRGLGKESSETAITTKHDDFSKNDSLNGKKGWIKKSTRNLEGKSTTHTNFWWTGLPFVMAVKMQSGDDGEESSGLFIVRHASGLPHTVAFEDHSDATNFCYLLESFFEDLHNFNTSIIHIPTNVLEEEVKSEKMKVVVVKKRQLKLYVGQPLEDVESALRALIHQQTE